MTKQDDLFEQSKGWGKASFSFDKRVSQVFDDMVNRSVPGYQTMQLLIADMALHFIENNQSESKPTIYDLGCSTGNTVKAILQRADFKDFDTDYDIIAIDQSGDMLNQAKKNIQSNIDSGTITWQVADISNLVDMDYPQVIILNLVLQFIQPDKRLAILANLYDQMPMGACLILVEKTKQDSDLLNDLFIDYYHEYKKEMGYSDLEIANKRDALENVLIPLSEDENIKMLNQAGFNQVNAFYRWMNFAGWVAVK